MPRPASVDAGSRPTILQLVVRGMGCFRVSGHQQHRGAKEDLQVDRGAMLCIALRCRQWHACPSDPLPVLVAPCRFCWDHHAWQWLGACTRSCHAWRCQEGCQPAAGGRVQGRAASARVCSCRAPAPAGTEERCHLFFSPARNCGCDAQPTHQYRQDGCHEHHGRRSQGARRRARSMCRRCQLRDHGTGG